MRTYAVVWAERSAPAAKMFQHLPESCSAEG